MLFGPKGYTKHILVPLGFELSLTLKVGKFIYFLCDGFSLGCVKMWIAFHYLRLTGFKLELGTLSKAFKQVL